MSDASDDPRGVYVSGKLLSWVGGLAAAGIVGLGTWLTSMHSQLQSQERRIAVLESQGADVGRRLDSIERKIDRLLEFERAK